jgi:hypothetical protein
LRIFIGEKELYGSPCRMMKERCLKALQVYGAINILLNKKGMKKMINHYLLTLQNKKKGNMELYKETLIEILGAELSWKEVQALEKDQLRRLTYTFENKIRLHQSPIDVKKLARAIQHSRSGMGGCAMTSFTCHFCNKEEIWSNTAVPNICYECATKMATKIAMYNSDILKESEINHGK